MMEELFSDTWTWGDYFKEIQKDGECKKLFFGVFFLTLYSFIALGYGYSQGLTGILASGFYTLFDSALALVVSLMGVLSEKKRSSLEYSYGYLRIEILGAFARSSFLMFTALYIVFESFEHILEPENLEMGYTMLIAILGLVIHIAVKLLFSSHVVNSFETGISEKRISLNTLVRQSAVDVTTYLSVFIGAWLVSSFEINHGDGVSAVLIAGIIAVKNVGLFYSSGLVLLQTVPPSLRTLIDEGSRDVSLIEGVLGVIPSKTHIWTFSPGVYVGTLHVRINGDADEQSVLRGIEHIFKPHIQHLSIQLEKWNDSIHII
jgi:cobalt-zinc-cadmium efflux system protein